MLAKLRLSKQHKLLRPGAALLGDSEEKDAKGVLEREEGDTEHTH